MNRENVYNLNITAESSSIESIEFNSGKTFYCSINFQDIFSAKFVEDEVLVIKFRDGEARLGISRSQLTGLLSIDEKKV